MRALRETKVNVAIGAPLVHKETQVFPVHKVLQVKAPVVLRAFKVKLALQAHKALPVHKETKVPVEIGVPLAHKETQVLLALRVQQVRAHVVLPVFKVKRALQVHKVLQALREREEI